jgi:hypothetical protein
MQGLVTRISSLASGVMNLNVCCAPEIYKEEQLPNSTRTNGDPVTPVLMNLPVSGDGDGRAQSRYRISTAGKSPRAGEFDNQRQPKTPLAGRYSGFLNRAAERGDETMLLAALKIDGNLLEGQDPSGNRALHLAAQKGHVKICQILCQVLRAATVRIGSEGQAASLHVSP